MVVKRCQWNKDLKIRVKNNNHIQVKGSFQMNIKNGSLVNYDLTTAIQHLGSPKDGHYVTHVNDRNQFFAIRDNKPVCKTQQFELELSQIFIYTNTESTH